MTRDKNQPRGQDHYCAKLNDQNVKGIKAIFKVRPEWTTAYIARIYNVSWNTIYDIKVGRTWRHIQ